MPEDKDIGYCHNCFWNRVGYQSHPYGSTTATEEIWECQYDETKDDRKGLEWNDDKSGEYGDTIPCPLWKLISYTCEKHGTTEGADFCPECEKEYEEEYIQRIKDEETALGDE